MLRYPDPPLADGGVGLRVWEIEDLALVEEASSDPLLLHGTTLPSPYEPDAGRTFVERQWSRQASGEGLSLAIAREGMAVGCATLRTRRPSVADLGYWLVDRARGDGVGGRAVALLVDWALTQPELTAVEAFVADDNVASQRVLDRAGFVHVGRARHLVSDLDDELRVYRRGAR